jgi:hypothetical protein
VPHHVSIDPTLGIAAVRAWGPVSLGEFLDYRTELASHSDFTPGMRVLIDLREAEFTPSGDEIRRLTTSSPFSGEALIAVLVPDDLHFGLARMWAVFGERTSGTLHPFRSLEKACEWLDVPPGEAMRLLTQ